MLKKGNGDKTTCVKNLLQMTRGEIPLDHMRGIRADLTDKPAAAASAFFNASARWVVENYEPRAAFDSIETQQSEKTGDISATAKIR